MASTNKWYWLRLSMIFIFGAVTACQAATGSISLPGYDVMYHKYEQWMSRYDRAYENSAEKERRFEIFKDNVAYIESSNSKNKSYKLGINQFTALTNEEFKATRTGGHTRPPKEVASFRYHNVIAASDSIDWIAKGAVTRVKNQGTCVVASMEGLIKITTGKLVVLSTQELVDCVSSDNDSCRNDGNVKDAFAFILSNGLSTEADYPYTETQGTCSQNITYAATITDYEYVPENDELALLRVVANQPVSVAVEASGTDFRHYTSGVFNGECGTQIDHNIAAVGYGTRVDGTKYWIMKNSWGTDWGEQGFIFKARDVSAPLGQYGLATDAWYPTSGRGKRHHRERPTSGGRKRDPKFIFFTYFITYFFRFLICIR